MWGIIKFLLYIEFFFLIDKLANQILEKEEIGKLALMYLIGFLFVLITA